MSSEQQVRVLIVDDDPSTRSMMTAALRRSNLVIDEAGGGAAAIHLLSQHQYAVVLLDLVMPRPDGFAVIDAIAAKEGASPVLLVVTGADQPLVERLDARRIHGVVRKPFDPEEIASVVAACAEIRGRSMFEAMALATAIGTGPLIALMHL